MERKASRLEIVVAAMRERGLRLVDLLEKGITAIEEEEERMNHMADMYEERFTLEGHNNKMEEWV